MKRPLVALTAVLTASIAGCAPRQAPPSPAVAPAEPPLSSAVADRVCPTLGPGIATFDLRTDLLDAALAKARLAAREDPEAAAGVALLENVTFRGHVDLGTGEVEIHVDHPEVDEVRTQLMRQAAQGLHAMVVGTFQAFLLIGKGALPTDLTGQHVTLHGQPRVAYSTGSVIVYVDPESLLPVYIDVPAPKPDIRLGRWEDRGTCHQLSEVDFYDPYTEETTQVMALDYVDIDGTWFPARMQLERAAREQVNLTFDNVDLRPED